MGLRIAIASSGLGHIRRGIEAWAEDVALALLRDGQDVTLFQGGGEPNEDWRVRLNCWQRFSPRTAKLVALTCKLGGWRYGLGSGYQAEQTTFALSLWRKVRKDYDILHVQDPWLALIMQRLHQYGLSRPRVILAHGTEENATVLRKYPYLQHLAPSHEKEWEIYRPTSQYSTAVPNFVDTSRFCPKDREAARARCGLSSDVFVVLSVAALKKTHKRCDYVITEFASFAAKCPKAILVLAGGREKETDEVCTLAKGLLNDRVRVLNSVPRDQLTSLYCAADVFVLGSLWEMMPIALLEALSSGLPVLCHDTPTLRWMTGSGGIVGDISEPGALARMLGQVLDSTARVHLSRNARARAISLFSEEAVVPQLKSMYEAVLHWNK